MLFLIILTFQARAELATNFSGVAYWCNSTNNLIYWRNWTRGTGFEAETNSFSLMGSTTCRHFTADYSRVNDVGVICTTDADADFNCALVNTTTGRNKTQEEFETISQSNQPKGGVMYWNMSDECLIFYEGDAVTDNSLQIRECNNTGFEAEATILQDDNDGNAGLNYWYNSKQRPGYNETAICYAADGEIDGVVCSLYLKDVGQFYNWSTNASINMTVSTTSGNFFNFAWTADGERFIIALRNNTAAGTGTVIFYIYNRTSAPNGSMSTHYYLTENLDFIEDVMAETIPGANDQVGFIFQDDSADVGAYIIYINGSTAVNAPTEDLTTERSTAVNNLAVATYKNIDKISLFYVNADSLAISSLFFNGTDKSWYNSTSSLDNIALDSDISGNAGSDDIENIIITPCPKNDCAMFCGTTLDSRNFCGAFFNGSKIDTGYNVNIGSSSGAGRTNSIFLFKGNETITAAPPPGDTCTPPGSGDYSVTCSDECIWTSPATIAGNMLLKGTGEVRLNNLFTFSGSGRHIIIDSGCQLSINSGGGIK